MHEDLGVGKVLGYGGRRHIVDDPAPIIQSNSLASLCSESAAPMHQENGSAVFEDFRHQHDLIRMWWPDTSVGLRCTDHLGIFDRRHLSSAQFCEMIEQSSSLLTGGGIVHHVNSCM